MYEPQPRAHTAHEHRNQIGDTDLARRLMAYHQADAPSCTSREWHFYLEEKIASDGVTEQRILIARGYLGATRHTIVRGDRIQRLPDGAYPSLYDVVILQRLLATHSSANQRALQPA